MGADTLALANQINIYQGESATITLKVKDNTGKAVDITGASVIMTVKTDINTVIPLFQKSTDNIAQIAITAPREGKAEIYLSSSDTATLNAIQYVYDIWVILATGKKHPVIKPSVFKVEQSVTKFV